MENFTKLNILDFNKSEKKFPRAKTVTDITIN